jgi:hypothetical protein
LSQRIAKGCPRSATIASNTRVTLRLAKVVSTSKAKYSRVYAFTTLSTRIVRPLSTASCTKSSAHSWFAAVQAPSGCHQVIEVKRAYVWAQFKVPKSKASKAPVPMHPALAGFLMAWRERTPYAKERTPYAKDGDYVFPSFRLKGKKPVSASIMVQKYLPPAAIKGRRYQRRRASPLRLPQLPAFAGFFAGEAEV